MEPVKQHEVFLPVDGADTGNIVGCADVLV